MTKLIPSSERTDSSFLKNSGARNAGGGETPLLSEAKD